MPLREFLAIAAAILTASLLVGITTHELMHLAFATEPTGICIGACPTSQGTSFAAAYGSIRQNTKSQPKRNPAKRSRRSNSSGLRSKRDIQPNQNKEGRRLNETRDS